MIKFHIVSPGEECAPKLLQVAKGFCSVHTEHIARRLALLVPVAVNAQFTNFICWLFVFFVFCLNK